MSARPEQFVIKRAERRQARLRFAICAASNGGKTWSALEVAFGIAQELISRGVIPGPLDGKVGIIDTERQSASLYAHLGPFDALELGPPYSVDRYIGAIQALERAGCAVIIIDSASHAWMGDGGVLRLLDAIDDDKRWRAFGTKVNPEQDRLVDAMLKSPAHIIATMRSRTKWVMQEKTNRAGHQVMSPKRVGMEPIQRPGIEYEFTTMVDLDTDTHKATVVKNRCPLFDNWEPKILSREHGRALAAWLLEGAEVPQEETASPQERATETAKQGIRLCEQAANIPDLQRAFQGTVDALRAFMGVVEEPELVSLRNGVIAAKDKRKEQLKPAPSNVGKTISPDDAVDLESMCAAGKVPVATITALFHVKRLSELAPEKLRDVVNTIEDEALAAGEVEEPPAIPPRLKKRLLLDKPATGQKPDAFAGFEDDLPWQP